MASPPKYSERFASGVTLPQFHPQCKLLSMYGPDNYLTSTLQLSGLGIQSKEFHLCAWPPTLTFVPYIGYTPKFYVRNCVS